MTRVLVFGKTGQLATGFQRLVWPQGWTARYLGRDDADLQSPDTVSAIIQTQRPDLVINAAAYTAVDKAQSEPDIARRINAVSPGMMASAAAILGVPFVTVSTDYVFDGKKPSPYQEDDPVAPLGVYGATKEEGERLVRAANSRHLILRTSWVYSAWGANFVRTMLRLGAEKSVLRVVADQYGRPTSAGDLAGAVLRASQYVMAGKGAFGTFHVANADQASWHGFAEAIFAKARTRHVRTPERVEAITTADYPTPAARPANSVLATEKFTSVFGFALRPWQTALDEVMEELLPGSAQS